MLMIRGMETGTFWTELMFLYSLALYPDTLVVEVLIIPKTANWGSYRY